MAQNATIQRQPVPPSSPACCGEAAGLGETLPHGFFFWVKGYLELVLMPTNGILMKDTWPSCIRHSVPTAHYPLLPNINIEQFPGFHITSVMSMQRAYAYIPRMKPAQGPNSLQNCFYRKWMAQALFCQGLTFQGEVCARGVRLIESGVPSKSKPTMRADAKRLAPIACWA